jgi:hypothetical protein
MSSCRAPLDTSWLDDSEDSLNADTNCDSELHADNNMPLPPEDFYTTQDELFDAIQGWAKEHRYAFRIGRWKNIGKHRRKYFYECDRCGPKPIIDRSQNDPRRPRDRIRYTASKKTGCKFSVCGVQVDDHHWEIRHRPDPKFGLHNHPQSHSALEHVAHRQLDQQQIDKARELHSIGMFRHLRSSNKQFG